MDSIIGLLVVLIPVVFTLVGKKLENAGKAGENAEETPSMPEVFPSIEEFEAEGKPAVAKKPEVVKEAVMAMPPKLPKQKVKAYAVKEDSKTGKKEPIDPKKLVIYSEIMKPKF